MTNRRTALYRFYDADDRLIYVGITVDLGQRWNKHASESPWWPHVAGNKVVWLDSRPEAEAAEQKAITEERPAYNRAGSVTPRNVTADFPIGDEVTAGQFRNRIADIVHNVMIRKEITYVTRNGRRIAAVVPVETAEAHEAQQGA